MSREDALVREIEALRHRLSQLSAASLHINASLDFDTVLQEILNSARSLTDACYGVIVLLADAGGIQDFLGSGLTPDETRRLWEMPEGLQFFEYLSSNPEPFRVADLGGHTSSMSLPAFRPPRSRELLPGCPHSPRGRGHRPHLRGEERAGPGVQPGGRGRRSSCSRPRRRW